jgi:hypothetical protein
MADTPHHVSIIGYWSDQQAPADQACGWPDPEISSAGGRAETVRPRFSIWSAGSAFAPSAACRPAGCGSPLGTGELTDGT